MPPDPELVIVFGTMFLSLVVSLIYAAWYQGFKHRQKREEGRAGVDSSRSIGVGELEEMIRKAVADANGELGARLVSLEREVRAPGGAAHEGRLLPDANHADFSLQLPDEAAASAEQMPVGQSTRRTR